MENSEILKLLNLDDHNKWILQDDKAKLFFEYIANNLNSANILSSDEIKQFECLQASRNVLEPDNLQDELKEVELNFPGFFSVNSDELEVMERKLKSLESELAERNDRIMRMQAAESRQLIEIAETEKKKLGVQHQNEILTKECLTKVQTLSNYQKTNQEKVDLLTQLYLQPQTNPSLMHQMALNQHSHLTVQFLGCLKLFMQQNFNITRSRDEIFNTNNEASKEILVLKKQIADLEKKNFNEQLNIAGMNFFKENILKYSNVSSDYNQVRFLIDEITMETENLKATLEVLQEEAYFLLQQSADQEVTDILKQSFMKKKDNCEKTLDRLNVIYNEVDEVAFMCELICVAMQLDKERLENRVDNSEKLNIEAQECNKRMRLMSSLKKTSKTRHLDAFTEYFRQILLNNLPLAREQLPTFDACYEEYLKFLDDLKAKVKSLSEFNHFSSVYKIMERMDSQMRSLNELIFNGPTFKPCINDAKFIIPIYEKEKTKKDFEKEWKEIKENFQKNALEPYQNDKFHRMKELLYIWFLTEPRKVILAIKEVQKKAAEEGSASFKALNIIVGKSDK